MKKIHILILVVLGVITLIVLAGMYKFNYLASLPGYDVDGNSIDLAAVQFMQPVTYQSPNNEAIEAAFSTNGEIVEVRFMAIDSDVYAKAFTAYQVPAASGTKYASKDGSFVFWTKGAEATIFDKTEVSIFSGSEVQPDIATPTSDTTTTAERVDITPSTPVTDTTQTPTPVLTDTTWRYVAAALVDEWVEVQDDTDITLNFTRTDINGNAGCNSFFGSYTETGNELTFGELGMTLMACDEEAMFQESVFMENLALVHSYTITESQLTLHYGEEVALIFAATPITIATTYDNCLQNEGYLLGAEENPQCAIDGQVHFSSGQDSISLTQCTTYYDGCNTSSVEAGAITGTTKMYCTAERGAPSC